MSTSTHPSSNSHQARRNAPRRGLPPSCLRSFLLKQAIWPRSFPWRRKFLILRRMKDAYPSFVAAGNALLEVRQGGLSPKDVKNDDRPGNVYENKGASDELSEKHSGKSAWSVSILQKKPRGRRLFTGSGRVLTLRPKCRAQFRSPSSGEIQQVHRVKKICGTL